MHISEIYPEEVAVGPHKKFMMFFTDNKVTWAGTKANEGEMDMEFIGCTICCSTYNHMRRVLGTRPEVLEFREKWKKEISPDELQEFINWILDNSRKNKTSIRPYDDILAAIGLALAPLYKTDDMAKEYIDSLEKCHGIMRFVGGEIIDEAKK